MMAEVGYKPGRAGGVIASGAILGPIIPPSTNFILLGATISGLSITKLFMIGLFPGIFIGLALMVVWFFIVRIDGYNETITFTREEKWKIIRDATPAFMMPVLLLGVSVSACSRLRKAVPSRPSTPSSSVWATTGN